MSWTDRLGDAFLGPRTRSRSACPGCRATQQVQDWKTEQDAKAKGQSPSIDTVNQWADRNVMTPASDALFGVSVGPLMRLAPSILRCGSPDRTVAQTPGVPPTRWRGADPVVSPGMAWDRSAEVSPARPSPGPRWATTACRTRASAPERPVLVRDQAAARRKYFHDTREGKLRSGTVDFAGNILLDPVAVSPKAGKALSVSSRTLKSAEETPKVIKVSEGDCGCGVGP